MNRNVVRLSSSIAIMASFASFAWCCSIPVFRYALEHWSPETYLVRVSSDSKWSESQLALVKELSELEKTANIRLILSEGQKATSDNHDSARLEVHMPRAVGGVSPMVWDGPFTREIIQRLFSSPVRQRICQGLANQDSVAWVFLESGDSAVDDAKFFKLESELRRLERVIRLPTIDEADLKDLSTSPEELKLELGKSITLLGRQFNVCKIQPERGSIEDMSLWIELGAAQEMLGMQNLIHAILALECDCAGDRISEIRREIAAILPGTQVIERYSQALTRAEARTESKRAAEEALALAKSEGRITLERERERRLELLHQQQALKDTLGPIVIVLTCVMVAALAFHNFRQRKSEIGLMRALGLGSTSILGAFLGKAVLIGALGGFIGVAIASAMIAGRILRSRDSTSMLTIWNSASLTATAIWIPVLMIVLTVVASWLAAFQAIRQDAAIVLQGE